MKKPITIFLFLFFSLFFLSATVNAIGISPGLREADYTDDEQLEFSYRLSGSSNAMDIEIVNSTLSEYVTISTNTIQPDEDKRFTATLELPPYETMTDFGEQVIRIQVRERPENTNGFSATTSVITKIVVYVPNPGSYAEIEGFSIETVNKGENSSYDVSIRNRGTNPFTEKTADMTITDSDDNEVTSLQLTSISAQADEVYQAQGRLETDDFDAGKYYATLEFDLDPELKPFTRETTFFVGSTDVTLEDYTTKIVPGSINKIELTLQSLWGSPLEGIRARVIDESEQSQPLPVIDFEPFEQKTVTAFYETQGEVGDTVNAQLELTFPEEYASVDTKTIPLRFELVEKKDVATTKLGSSASTSLTWLTAVISVLVVLGVVIVLLRKGKKKKLELQPPQ